MERIQMIQSETATPEQEALLAQVKSAFGMVPNLTRAMAASPAVLEAFLSFGGAMSKSGFSDGQREQIAIAVAQWNGCEYCLSAHTKIAEMMSVTDEERAAAREFRSSDPVVRAALSLAHAVLEHKGRVSDGDVAAAKEAGLTEAQIADVGALVVQNIFTNYYNHLAGTPNDWPVVRVEELATR